MEEPLKIFISYAHEDEMYVQDLKKHLTTLERQGIAESWYDRQLSAGDELDVEISQKLSQSDLVVFVVSIDFLTSWYCLEVELKATIDRMPYSDVRVVPLIVRTCNWKDTELGKYLAATKDGVPISDYPDKDKAWTEVVDRIKDAAMKMRDLRATDLAIRNPVAPKSLSISKEMASRIEDTQIKFSHRVKGDLALKDIFVSPDLKNIKREYDDIESSVDALTIIRNPKNDKVVILGAEQSGKTSLAKITFDKLYQGGFLPIYIDGGDLKNLDVERLVKKAGKVQYEKFSVPEYLKEERRKVLIVDNYDRVAINVRHQHRLIEAICELFDRIIFLSATKIRYDEGRYVELSDFQQYEILPFGNVKRGELIEKWVSAGREETIDIRELHNQVDRVTTHVNGVIRKNLLPRTPIYVLTIIQLLESARPSDYALTSYGHCYQSLIQSGLERVGVEPSEFDLYINYLTELAGFIFFEDADALDEDKLPKFQAEYSRRFLIDSHRQTTGVLLQSRIMVKRDGEIGFGYKYIFYFYAAKYLAEYMDEPRCEKAIERLCTNIGSEKNANILIFIVHHSKDQKIVDEILLHASLVFDSYAEAALDKEDTSYLIRYIKIIPDLVIESRDVDKERRTRLEQRDEIENICDTAEEEEEFEAEDNDVLADIDKSARLVEIIGQILRNRYGSLERSQLLDLTRSAYSSGLRFLNFFLESTRENQEYLLDFISKLYRDKVDVSDEDVAVEARRIFLMFCYGASFSVVKKIAGSVGSDKLMPIFKQVFEEGEKTPAEKLIYVAILLDFKKEIPKKELAVLYHELDGNPIARRLLQEIVIQHLYLNHVDYKDRQWISSKISLPMDTQRLIQGKSELQD